LKPGSFRPIEENQALHQDDILIAKCLSLWRHVFNLPQCSARQVENVPPQFRNHVQSKSDVAMKNEVLCKFLCHNIVVVHQSIIELGIEGVFWDRKPKVVSPLLKFPGVG